MESPKEIWIATDITGNKWSESPNGFTLPMEKPVKYVLAEEQACQEK